MDRTATVQRFAARLLPLLRATGGALALTFVAGALTTAQAQQGQGGEYDPFAIRSTLDGVYTEEQAAEGLEVFNNICSNCHNAQNPLGGSSFMRNWTGKPLYAVWEFMLTRMPYGAPGSLTPKQYSAVLAYVLQRSGYPAGNVPIPELAHEIANIDFDPLETR